jgi:hypothetical protein
MIYKNWPKDERVGYHFAKKDVREFFTFKVNLFEAHKEELDQSSCFEDDL